MIKCKQCLLPETVPKISFDNGGICNYCNKHQKVNYIEQSELIDQLNAYRNPSAKYDCIVTISGGRDSTYTLLKVAKDYGMKVLAVNFVNPYTHPQASINIDKAVKLLNVDLIKIIPKKSVFEECLKNNLKTWIRRPSLSMLPMLCTYCRTMEFEFYRLAKKHKIRCLINGANPMQNTSFISELVSVDSTTSFARAITKSLPYVIKQIVLNPGYLAIRFLPIAIKSYITAIINAFGPNKFGFDLKIFGFFYYIEWNEKEVEYRIQSELDWQHPDKKTQRFDCPISYIKDFIYWKTIGITKMDDYYAKMIRDGLISREVASQKIAENNNFDIETLESLFKTLGVDYFTFFRKTHE